MIKKQYIHAEKNDKGGFDPYEVSSSLSAIADGYEYGDVAEGKYQIWELPSGKIFDVRSDRIVSDKDYYSPPSDGLWLPELKYVRTDRDLVEGGYERLKNMPERPSLLKRLFKW